MKDLFYTILVVWILWRIINSVNSYRSKKGASQQYAAKKEGETTVNFVPPKKKPLSDSEGEYVDYEEIK